MSESLPSPKTPPAMAVPPVALEAEETTTSNTVHTPPGSSSPADSDKTVVMSSPDEVTTQETMSVPGLRRAIFSTELGTRPPRLLRGPPFPPVIVRSNVVLGVVEAAMFWRKKFPRLAMCIFPDSGWEIEDFWDEEDIYIDTPGHYREVLKFMSQDNFWCARKFAEEWSRKYPEQVANTVGLSSMESIYDPNDPGAIVDKIFVNGEIEEKPRQFLWHVAHIMRATIVALREQQALATVPKDDLKSPLTDLHLTGIKQDEALMANPSSTQPGPLMPSFPQPSSMPSEGYAPSNPYCTYPPAPFVPPYGPAPPNAYPGQPIGHIMNNIPAQNMVSPPMSAPDLRNPKNRPNHNTSYKQPNRGPNSENLSRGMSGNWSSRATSGGASALHTPHLNHASMALGSPHLMQTFPYGYSSMQPPQHYPPGLAHPDMMVPPGLHFPNPHMVPGYVQQAPNVRGSRRMSIVDMTNNPYYTNKMPPQHIDLRRPPNRRNSLGNGNGNGHHSGSLYDPYNGAKPAFNDSHMSRKPSRPGLGDQLSHPRRHFPGDNKVRTSSYGADRNDTAMANSHRHFDHRPAKPRLVDDLEKVGDKIRGCGHDWIGPENEIVQELFVGDLPDDIRMDELHNMFARDMGVVPSNILIRKTSVGLRIHAFVEFASLSDAKLALKASHKKPLIRGILVKVSVPRRFYQKELGGNIHDAQQTHVTYPKGRDVRGVPRKFSHGEESPKIDTETEAAKQLYSPQDARSDLQKKVSHRSLKAGPTSTGSPNASVPSSQQPSSPKHATSRLESPIKEDIIDEKNSELPLASTSEVMGDGEPNSVEVKGETTVVEPADTDASRGPGDVFAANNKGLPVSPGKAKAPVELAGIDNKESSLQSQSPDQTSSAEGNGEVLQEEEEPLKHIEASASVANKPAVFPTSTSTDIQEAKDEKATESEVNSLSQQITPSDEEEGLDESFSSAQEVFENTETAMVHGGGTNHGIVSLNNSAPEGSLVKTTIPESSTDHTLAKGVATEVNATKTSIQREENQTTDTANSVMDVTTTAGQLSAETSKRHGPQQTPSLNPFAKPTKAQRQKEKEQKKREKKKEQEERASKGKTDKVISAPVKDLAMSASMDQKSQSATELLVQPDEQAPSGITEGTKGKDKGNAELQTKDTSDQALEVEDRENVSGEQTGGDAITTEEVGPIAEKVEVARKVTTGPVYDPLILTALGTIATSLKQKAASKTDSPITPTSPVKISEKEPVKKSDTAAAAKGRKPIPAVPNLNLGPRQSSTRSKISQPSSTTTTIPSKAPALESKAIQPTLHCQSQSPREARTVNLEAITQFNITLQSPSPTADAFYTPLQTPAVPSAVEDESSKPKKKKKNKKKKKAAGATTPPADTIAEEEASVTSTKDVGTDNASEARYTHEPFGKDMSHADAIRLSTRDPDTYYNSVDPGKKQRKNEKALKESGFPETGKGWRNIESFLRENPEALNDIQGSKH